MALSVEVGTKAIPASTGVQTYSLTGPMWNSGDVAKAVIVWATHATADGETTVIGTLAYGFGIQDGGRRKAYYISETIDPSNTASRIMTSATGEDRADTDVTGPLMLAVHITPNSTTKDWEIRLDDLTTDQWAIEVVNAPTTANIRLHYIVLGGSDITAADIGVWGVSTTADFSFRSGFGQPDLLHVMSRSQNGEDYTGTLAGNFSLSLGWLINVAGTLTQRAQIMYDQDAAGTMVTATQQDSVIAGGLTTAAAADWMTNIAAVANWPTDGVEVTVSDPPGAGTVTLYALGLKGTFQKAMGTTLTPTSNSNVDLNAGFAPRLGLVWGHNMPAGTGIQRAAANAAANAIAVGASDGTNEHTAGLTQDDGGTVSRGRGYNATTKAINVRSGAASTTIAEADGSFTGNNYRLAYTTSDAVQRQLSWLVLGSAAAGAPTSLPHQNTPYPVLRLR